MTSPPPIRALLIAEACNPEFVSVPLVGWSHARAILNVTRSHLVTQIRNREAILRAGLIEGKDFTAIDSEPLARPVYKFATLLRGGSSKSWTTNTALSALIYPYFEHLVWQKLGSRIIQGEFDIVHRITPLSPTMPSFLAGKCKEHGIPFILGPLNGGVPWPKEFNQARHQEKEWLSYVRDAYKLLPGYRSTRRNSAAILVASRDTLKQMPRQFHGKCVYLPENAIDPARFGLQRQRKAVRPIKAIFIGRLVPYKGADMLLEAAAPLIRAGELTVDIIGDGPQMPLLKEIVAREGIAAGVKLPGWVKHDQVQNWLADSDILTFPSVREFGGGVVLEAMAIGVVPIVVNYGGPAELVADDTGFLIPVGPRQQIIADLRTLLNDLVKRPGDIDDKSDAARERAMKDFTWDAKAQKVLEIYRNVIKPL